MSLETQLAGAVKEARKVFDLVTGQFGKWDGQVKAQIDKLENWKNNFVSDKTITGTATGLSFKSEEFNSSNAFVTIHRNKGHLNMTFLVKIHCCQFSASLVSGVTTYNTKCEIVRSDEDKYSTKLIIDEITPLNEDDGWNDYSITITKIKGL